MIWIETTVLTMDSTLTIPPKINFHGLKSIIYTKQLGKHGNMVKEEIM